MDLSEFKAIFVCNRTLWKVISSHNCLPKSFVSEQLQAAAQQLRGGVQFFKPPSEASDARVKKYVEAAMRASAGRDVLCNLLFERINKFLALDAEQAWDLMRYYLLYGFKGEPEDLALYLEDRHKNELISKDIEKFYRSERLHLLKCINAALTFSGMESHPLKDLLREVMGAEASIVQSTISQVRSLLSAAVPSARSHGELVTKAYQKQWYYRNLQEQVDAAHNLLLSVSGHRVEPSSVQEIVALCVSHDFGRRQPDVSVFEEKARNLFQKIGYLEVLVILKSLALDSLEESQLYREEVVFREVSSMMDKLGHRPEHGPVLLAWMIVVQCHPDMDQDAKSKYARLGSQVIKLDVFTFLESLLSETAFKEQPNCAAIAHEVVYWLLFSLVDNFEVDDWNDLPKIYSATAVCLRNRATLDLYWGEEPGRGLNSLCSLAARSFPAVPLPFSSIVESLAQCGPASVRRLVEVLRAIPCYGDELDAATAASLLQPVTSSVFLARHDHTTGTGLAVPTGTVCHVLVKKETTIVSWDITYSFFHVVSHELATFVSQVYVTSNVEKFAKLVSLLTCLSNLMNSKCIVEGDIVFPVETIFKLIERFSNVPSIPSEILARCLDIVTALWPKYSSEIATRLGVLKFLPSIQAQVLPSTDSNMLEMYHCGSLGLIIINTECGAKRYPLLISYLKFVELLMKPDAAVGQASADASAKPLEAAIEKNYKLLLPAVQYVLQEVFPQHGFWQYESRGERDAVTLACLQTLQRVLAIEEGVASSSPVSVLHGLCYRFLLEEEGAKPLLKIVGTGNEVLCILMEQQMSWLEGPGLKYISIVRLALAILGRVLLLHSNKKGVLSPLEELIYSDRNDSCGCRIIEVVVSYVHNSYNSYLATLAVEVLRRFALALPTSLKMCMGMDPDVIRFTFLSGLKNKEEAPHLKAAVLNFVRACVEKQAGLADVLFCIQSPQRDDLSWLPPKPFKEREQGGCLVYACFVLESVLSEPERIKHEEYTSVMKLLYALWVHRRTGILEFLRNRKNFWNHFCYPLFINPYFDTCGYQYIFNILSMELFDLYGKVAPELQENLDKLFDPANKYLEMWAKFVPASLLEEHRAKGRGGLDGVALLLLWKNFLLIALGMEDRHVAPEQRGLLAGSVMGALLDELGRRANQLTGALLAELYLYLIGDWKGDCFADKVRGRDQIVRLLQTVAESCSILHTRCVEAVLGLSLPAVTALSGQFKQDVVSSSIMQSCITLVSYEISVLCQSPDIDEQQTKDGSALSKKSMPFVLAMRLLSKLVLELDSSDSWKAHFKATRIMDIILAATRRFLQITSHLPLAVECVDVIAIIANSSLSSSLKNLDLPTNLFIHLLPPIETHGPQAVWLQTQWVTLYRSLLTVVTSLLRRNGVHFLDDAVTFVAVHERHLVSAMLITQHSLEQTHTELARSALLLLQEMTRWHAQWAQRQYQSLTHALSGIISCLEYCVSFWVKPAVISNVLEKKLLTNKQKLNEFRSAPIEHTAEFASVCNRLLQLIIISLACLLPFSPRLDDLVTSYSETERTWLPIVEISFALPCVHSEPRSVLAIGTVVKIIHTCVQSLLKTARSPSPRRMFSASSVHPALNPSWVGVLDKGSVAVALEMSLQLTCAQGILLLRSATVPDRDKHHLQRELISVLTLLLEYARRNFRESWDSLRQHSVVQSDGETSVADSPGSTSLKRSLGSSPSGTTKSPATPRAGKTPTRNLTVPRSAGKSPVTDSGRRRSSGENDVPPQFLFAREDCLQCLINVFGHHR
ncbi:nucleoporin Nup188 [Bacillus rossius redtenbacheri]|uniref:nucleoporin Nup188 n=1 Tax=Bacillus rossius redtenbacheri TaxID=93214 RepID=UPI002FDEF3F2